MFLSHTQNKISKHAKNARGKLNQAKETAGNKLISLHSNVKEKAGKHGELAGKQLDKLEKMAKKGARATKKKILKRVSTL